MAPQRQPPVSEEGIGSFLSGLARAYFSRIEENFGGGLEVAGFRAGIGTAGTGFGVLIGTVSRATPPEKRSQTIGLVAAAGSLGTMVLAPIGQSLINGFGWKAAMIAFAAIAASMALLSLPIRESNEKHAGEKPSNLKLGEALREAMGHRGYLFMTLAFFARVFGLTHFNSLYGVVFLSHQVGSFLGAWMGGLVFDRTGNYNFAWGALIVIGITAFTLQWLMDERPPRERKPAGPLAPAAA